MLIELVLLVLAIVAVVIFLLLGRVRLACVEASYSSTLIIKSFL
jgi:Sec-independent protein translocase protein TatA